MDKEEKRKYIYAQLGSLPNTFQYVEVTKYIENLEQQVKKQKEAIDKAIRELDIIIDDLEEHGNKAPAPSKKELCKIFGILKEVSK